MDELKITVRFFASYREKAGTSETVVDIPDGATVGDLTSRLAESFPDLTSRPIGLVVAVNQEYRDHSFGLSDGDEAAVIPPVSGGRS
ncbi:MAG: molybdopterin converting factor subunit 1 [SAR202 cluster bacterium]|nr:molybdopterin converting factor subunit 1 [SAR202 cluster bacterium]MDP6665506.1 molybdopterin converting factor subunit 1 [SAR202 cluster bacterium]MDP6798300.1 molybdopterin converting factor subunit 1 [SAR202 cluster bacterium]